MCTLIPLYFAPNPFSAKIMDISQLFIVILIASICWGGEVYLSQEFGHLIQKRIITEVKGANKNNFLKSFFNGVYFKNTSGRGFRLYLRSVILFFLIVATEWVQLHQSYPGQVVLASFNLLFFNHNFLYFPIFTYSLIFSVNCLFNRFYHLFCGIHCNPHFFVPFWCGFILATKN